MTPSLPCSNLPKINFSYFEKGYELYSQVSGINSRLTHTSFHYDPQTEVRTTTISERPNPAYKPAQEFLEEYFSKFDTFGTEITDAKTRLCSQLAQDRVIYPELMKNYTSKWSKTLLLVWVIFSTLLPLASIAAIRYGAFKGISYSISPLAIIKKGVIKLQNPLYGSAIFSGVVASISIFVIFSRIRWSNFGFYQHPLEELGPSEALSQLSNLQSNLNKLNLQQIEVNNLKEFLDENAETMGLNSQTISEINEYAQTVLATSQIFQNNNAETLLNSLIPVLTIGKIGVFQPTKEFSNDFKLDVTLKNPRKLEDPPSTSQEFRAKYRPSESIDNASKHLLERRTQDPTFWYTPGPDYRFFFTPGLLMLT